MDWIKKLKNNDLISNIISGISIRAISFAFSYLLTVPYLIRILGEGKFGLISFSVGIVSLFYPIVEYGFALTAPHDVASNLSEKEKAGNIISRILWSKIILLSFSLVLLSFFVFLNPVLAQEKELHLLSFSLLIGQALAPNWLYQGMNRLGNFAILYFFINLLIFICVVVLIKDSADYKYVNIIQGAIWVISYVLMLLFVLLPYREALWCSFVQIRGELRKGKYVFMTHFLNSTYVTTNIVVLGFFVTGKSIDDYSYAEKIYLMIRTALGVVYQMSYSKLLQISTQQSEEATNQFLKKLISLLFLGALVSSVVLYMAADLVIYVLTGKTNPEAAEIMRILTFAPLFYAISIPLSQKMLVMNKTKIYSLILLMVVVCNVFFNVVLASTLQGKGTAYAVLLTEVLYLLLAGSYTIKKIFASKTIQSS